MEIKKGNLNYENDMMNIYAMLDKQDLLLEEGIMNVVKFKNIINRACKFQDFETAKYFFEKYSTFIRKKDRMSVQNFCLSLISFYQKDYEKALDHITQVNDVNFVFESNYRYLLMKIYFERDKNYSEKTERFYRSVEKYFNDNKSLSAEMKKSYKNFTQILINLYRFKHNEGRMTLQKLKAKLEQQDYNADKKWLLEKMAELEK